MARGADFDDDDFYDEEEDYSDDQYNDDYDPQELEIAVNKVIAGLEKRKVPVEVIEDAIFEHDFDTKAAIDELKKKYSAPVKKPKSGTPTPSSSAVPSKPASGPSLAKMRALKKAAQQESTDSPLVDNSAAQQTAPTTSTNSLNLLDKLQAKHGGAPEPSPSTSSSSSSLASLSSTSSLAKTKSSALQKLAARAPKTGQSTITKPTESKLKLLRKPATATTTTTTTSAKPSEKPSASASLSLSSSSSSSSSLSTSLPISIFPEIDYNLVITPQPRSSALFYTDCDSDSDAYTPRISYSPNQRSNFLYSIESTPKVKKPFSLPSPDDTVLAAQSQSKGFVDEATAKSLSNLRIDSGTPKKLKYNVLEEIKRSKTKKPVLCFVVIGHVDAGKSTLMGRLLLDTGAVSKNTVAKYEKASKEIGKQSFALAWVMDKTDEERSRGITVDVCSSIFETDKRHFTILDAPGHRDFVPNMIEGSSRADVALLVIDSSPNAFESGFFSDGQTREHAIVARSLGIEQIVVAVNKLDAMDWSEARFQAIEEQLGAFLQRVGFQSENTTFVPCSGLSGVNVTGKKQKLPEELSSWYKGLSVLEALEAQELPERDYAAPFRMRVIDVEAMPHMAQIVVSGRVDYGTVQEGQELIAVPAPSSGKQPIVKSIHNYDREKESIPWAKAGDYVELVLTGILPEDLSSGTILCGADAPAVGYTSKFVAKLTVFDMDKPILKGNTMVMHYAGSRAEVQVSKLVALLEKNGKDEVAGKTPRLIKGGQKARVQISVLNGRSIPIETFEQNRDLGRIILRREGKTVAVGIVESLK
ncbi:uncharacterized protein SAPINGB_P005470 [Magnusiomyces paraingens]|uniref:Elongation factor 1 alpha-like protein n=1 Tax=Magnusiomyces paraingens TaxID=2606893 RepID=A0A5E8BZW5_9ASCO|nr:uncharacterized protein SAPINGB_P005470 [Saprochaete ingens]VVT56983.1 unnamed protein product [Saprochaete ingens]